MKTTRPNASYSHLERRSYLLLSIFLSIAWLSIWYWPWYENIRSFIWLQTGLGLFLFTIPGICVYGLLIKQSRFTINHVTFGFVISHLFIALIGIGGRLIHLSFSTIKLIFVVVSLYLILAYIFPLFIRRGKINLIHLHKEEILPVLFLLITIFITCLVIIQRALNDDDLTYLAYITNWQHSNNLDFNDIIFGEPDLVHTRFWVMSVPFAQALISDISHTPGIVLLSGYLEAFLAILAVLCWYSLARTLRLSPQAASAASSLNLVFLLFLSEYLHPGAPFFRQLSADKAIAAFIMAPVFFQSLIKTLRNTSNKSIIILALVGFSLTFTHPVITAYAVFIGGILILLTLKKNRAAKSLLLLSIIVVVLLPQVVLRFIPSPDQEEIPYSTEGIFTQKGVENMIQRWENSRFYGFNPSILGMKIPYGDRTHLPQTWLARGWLILPLLSALIALYRIKNNAVAKFIVSCFLLGALAGIPFTGWVVGYFLSAYMLERALWLFPFGLSLVFIFVSFLDYLKLRNSKISGTSQANNSASNRFLFLATTFSISMIVLYMRENALPNFEKFSSKTQRYQNLALAGQELDKRIDDHAFVIGSPQLNDLIPAISSKSRLITFRITSPSNMIYFSEAERLERIEDTTRLFAKNISTADQMAILEKYDVDFLFLQSFDLRLFDDLLTGYPDRVQKIEAGGVIILQIN